MLLTGRPKQWTPVQRPTKTKRAFSLTLDMSDPASDNYPCILFLVHIIMNLSVSICKRKNLYTRAYWIQMCQLHFKTDIILVQTLFFPKSTLRPYFPVTKIHPKTHILFSCLLFVCLFAYFVLFFVPNEWISYS